MPNECFNYIRITVPDSEPQLKALFLERPFVPEAYFDPPSPNGSNDRVLMDWRLNTFGTDRFWANYMLPQNPTLSTNKNNITGFFQTAWAPPLEFYKKLAKLYPSVEFYYEYNEWHMGLCGYGTGDTIHEHYSYDTKEELEEICKSHDWYMQPFNPHFDVEFISGTRNN